MITQAILQILFLFGNWIFSFLPEVSWDVNTSAMGYFLDIVRVVGYLLPAATVTLIAQMIIAITVFRIFIAVIRTVWDLIPFA